MRDHRELSLNPRDTEQPRCSGKDCGIIPQQDVQPFSPHLMSLKCLGAKSLGFSEHLILRHHLLEWPHQDWVGINYPHARAKGMCRIELREQARGSEGWSLQHSLVGQALIDICQPLAGF